MPSLSTRDRTVTRDALGRFLKLSVFAVFASLLLVVNSTSGVASAKSEAGVGAPVQLLNQAVAPAGLQPGGGFPENPFARPRFIINAVSMYARDETGVDWPFSDEIVWNFASNSDIVTTRVYGDMDAGESVAFVPANRCMVPLADPDGERNNAWACGPGGSGAPIDVIVSIYEHEGWKFPNQFCADVEGNADL